MTDIPNYVDPHRYVMTPDKADTCKLCTGPKGAAYHIPVREEAEALADAPALPAQLSEAPERPQVSEEDQLALQTVWNEQPEQHAVAQVVLVAAFGVWMSYLTDEERQAVVAKVAGEMPGWMILNDAIEVVKYSGISILPPGMQQPAQPDDGTGYGMYL